MVWCEMNHNLVSKPTIIEFISIYNSSLSKIKTIQRKSKELFKKPTYELLKISFLYNMYVIQYVH